ncbi:MAG: EAL domain-containing protein [Lachnospiraceae bacterium]|nr:EAL domain-containing protein [Lachnospiraceae bacterium]
MHDKPIMLIVDDSEMSRGGLKRVFLGEYEFIEAKNGQEAMEILRAGTPVSIILLDAIMPQMNGFQFLEKMQEDSNFSGIPIVMVTQQDDEYTEIKALELGAADFIAKPFKSQIIRRRVKNIVVKNQLEFKYKSKYDKLTGIYTKDTFIEKTSQMLRENTHKKYVIIRWNIERFKLINDLFGVKEGDKILIGMAKTLAELIKGIGTYGRLERDHFVMCLPYYLLDIEEIIKRINEGVGRYKADYAVASNFGIYMVDDITLPVDIMCDRANLALQSVRGNITKPYAFYKDKYRSSLLEEQRLIKDINIALAEEQFEVYYQPIFSLSLGKVVSAEALVRWNHPIKKIIPAGQFISIFEKNGFIMQLDVFVLETVCKQLKEWKDSGEQFLPVSVNISSVNIYEPDFCNKVMELVRKYVIDTSMLQFEITENTYSKNTYQHSDVIKTLQKRGFSILMDDFGSGYSSFNMLKDVPIDALKVDLRFLEDFDKSGRFGSIITAVVRMAKWLNMPVIAVGVETKGQLDFLKSIGCDMVQGYFFSRPLPKLQFQIFVKKSDNVLQEKIMAYDESINYNELFNPNFVSNQIFNSIIGGIGIYELVEDRLEVIRVNDGYYQTMGYNPQTLYEDAGNILCKVFEEDRVLLIEKCRNVCKSRGLGEIVLRRYDGNGKLLWLDVNIKYLGGNIHRPLFCFTFKDITTSKGSKKTDTPVVSSEEE